MNPRLATRPAGKLWETAALIGCCLLSACSSPAEPSAVEQGRQLFESKALSSSHLNDYTCASCHDTVASTPPSKKAGGALAGVTLRSTFWGGQEADLLGSINACRNDFMADNRPLVVTEERARSLYAYLESLEPGDANPIPFTVVTTIDPLPRGDESHGQVLFAQTCLYCHGSMHDGSGRLSSRLPILPEDTLVAHAEYSARLQRLVFTEKIRHGLFLGYGGVMPPFSTELLSDQDVSDLLEALGVLGE
ncbi:MAG TPA: c-type cytochrome [Polyangiaceae bacterium]|jgi:thiosulfate dehydrogenase|nr:c-type cytochrome [Polyangiaceae bacterium]